MREFIRLIKKRPGRTLCFLLICAFMLQICHPAIAAENITYIEDVQLCTADSADEAQAYFSKMGYTMVNADLDSGTGGKSVYMGYKTTKNRTDAVTDIKMMPMEGGYQTYDYDKLMTYLRSQATATAASLKKAADGFIAQYKAGSPRAADACLGLNMFRVGSADMQLGDFILAGKADSDFFVDVVARGSSAAVHAVANFLNLGLSQYHNDRDDDGNTVTTGWAGMVGSSYLWERYEKGLSTDDAAALDRKYEDTAKILFRSVQKFTTDYENAATRFENNENSCEMSVEIDDLAEGVEHFDEMTAEDTDVSYLTAFELLNSFDLDENTKMGDWFLDIGHQTSDTVDYRMLYPVIESMSIGMASLISVTGFLSAVWNLADNAANTEFRDAVAKFQKDFGEEGVELFMTMDDEFKGKTFGYTSEAVRKQGVANLPGLILERVNDKAAQWQLALKEISLYVGIATTAIAGTLLLANLGVAMTTSALGAAAATSSIYGFFSSLAAGCTGFMTFTGVIGMAILVVGLAIALGVWLFTKYAEENKADFQSKKPDYFFDAVKGDGLQTFVLYKTATDFSKGSGLDLTGEIADLIAGNTGGAAGDLNARNQWRWVVLCFTKDKYVGSPLRLDENGECFRVVYGNSGAISGYSSVRYFDQRSAGDMNAHCEKNSVGGIYMHYVTEDSYASQTGGTADTPDSAATQPATATDAGQDQPAGTKTYIMDIILGIGTDSLAAEAEITGREDTYYLLSENLSPGTGLYTRLGYRLTQDPAQAITDLRVAPYAGGPNAQPVLYGDVIYTQIDILGYDTGKGNKINTPSADALYYTKDPEAGSPIAVDGLHVIRNLADLKDGWEPVSYFGCDIPYDFNTKYEVLGSTGMNYYGRPDEGTGLLNAHQFVYLYYEPTKQYTSGEKYLTGMFFVGGYDIDLELSGVKMGEFINTADSDLYMASLFVYSALPRCELASKTNLANTISGMYNQKPKTNGEKELYGYATPHKHGNTQQYLLYTWSYNPKRALSNLSIFQGDSFAQSLPYAFSKPTGNTTCNYVAAINMQQQYAPGYQQIIRFVSPQNACVSTDALVLDGLYRSVMAARGTAAKQEGITFGYGTMYFLPTELYVSGPTAGMQPLTLSDVVVTDRFFSPKTNDTKLNYSINVKTLAGVNPDPKKIFRPVTEMKNPNGSSPFSLAYPKSVLTSVPLYIYMRGQLETPKKYIASISVGSASRKLYSESNPRASENELKMVDAMVNMQAMAGAASGCTDETIVYNFALANQNNAWYNKQSGGIASREAPENSPAAYLGVTRTDNPDKAVKGVILYKSNLKQAKTTVEIDNVTYNCASTTAPIHIGKDKYYLYYTTNKGVVPGVPITDITVSEIPLVDGCATNLCGKEGDSKNLFGNPSQPTFLHLHYAPGDVEYYNKLYIGRGSNERDAMCELLSQGCVQYVKMDLNNKADGDTVLLGYRTGCHDYDAVKGMTGARREKELARQEDEVIYDVVTTTDEPYHPEGIVSNGVYYTPVSDVSLNAGCLWGAEIYMYYASAFYSGRYNRNSFANTALPGTVFTGYITRIAFGEHEHVPYLTVSEYDAGSQTYQTTELRSGGIDDYYPWEYVLESGDMAPVDLNEGAVYCNGYNCTDTRLHMFVQRSDGSIKPAGEITGGYVESKYPVGDVYAAK